MKTATLLAVALVLAGCATTAPIRETQVVDRAVPVLEKPITAAEIPTVPAPLGPRPSDIRAGADLLLAKVCEFVSYAERANPLLRLSAGLEPGQSLAFPECAKRGAGE